jgi:hypothetical protein
MRITRKVSRGSSNIQSSGTAREDLSGFLPCDSLARLYPLDPGVDEASGVYPSETYHRTCPKRCRALRLQCRFRAGARGPGWGCVVDPQYRAPHAAMPPVHVIAGKAAANGQRQTGFASRGSGLRKKNMCRRKQTYGALPYGIPVAGLGVFTTARRCTGSSEEDAEAIPVCWERGGCTRICPAVYPGRSAGRLPRNAVSGSGWASWA